MLVPWRALNGRHLATAQWVRGVERKIRRLVEEELREISEKTFLAYCTHLDNVTAFKYLGRVIKEGDEDWPSVTGILQKVKKGWWQMLRVFSQEGADPKVSGHFFKAVV